MFAPLYSAGISSTSPSLMISWLPLYVMPDGSGLGLVAQAPVEVDHFLTTVAPTAAPWAAVGVSTVSPPPTRATTRETRRARDTVMRTTLGMARKTRTASDLPQGVSTHCCASPPMTPGGQGRSVTG